MSSRWSWANTVVTTQRRNWNLQRGNEKCRNCGKWIEKLQQKTIVTGTRRLIGIWSTIFTISTNIDLIFSRLTIIYTCILCWHLKLIFSVDTTIEKVDAWKFKSAGRGNWIFLIWNNSDINSRSTDSSIYMREKSVVYTRPTFNGRYGGENFVRWKYSHVIRM